MECTLYYTPTAVLRCCRDPLAGKGNINLSSYWGLRPKAGRISRRTVLLLPPIVSPTSYWGRRPGGDQGGLSSSFLQQCLQPHTEVGGRADIKADYPPPSSNSLSYLILRSEAGRISRRTRRLCNPPRRPAGGYKGVFYHISVNPGTISFYSHKISSQFEHR